jgi:hypothetical protein
MDLERGDTRSAHGVAVGLLLTEVALRQMRQAEKSDFDLVLLTFDHTRLLQVLLLLAMPMVQHARLPRPVHLFRKILHAALARVRFRSVPRQRNGRIRQLTLL